MSGLDKIGVVKQIPGPILVGISCFWGLIQKNWNGFLGQLFAEVWALMDAEV